MTYTAEPQPCGTQARWQRHRYHGESPCDECVAANRQYHNDRAYRRYKAPKIPDHLVDVLEIEDRWLTREILIAIVLDVFPTWKPDSISRALARLVAAGEVESKVDPDDPIGNRMIYRRFA